MDSSSECTARGSISISMHTLPIIPFLNGTPASQSSQSW
uniref:Uncharacterized protein n=1 Tax=Anguilla anguilla TaxID=7936 RepID=A0A0E9STZ7_ANGAN